MPDTCIECIASTPTLFQRTVLAAGEKNQVMRITTIETLHALPKCWKSWHVTPSKRQDSCGFLECAK